MMNLIKWINHKHTAHYFVKVMSTGRNYSHRDVINRIIALDRYDVNTCEHTHQLPILSRRKNGFNNLIRVYNADATQVAGVDKATDYIFLDYIHKFMARYNITKKDYKHSINAKTNISDIVINGMDASPGNKLIMALLNDINRG